MCTYARIIKIIKINLKERNPLSSWSNEVFYQGSFGAGRLINKKNLKTDPEGSLEAVLLKVYMG